MHGTNYCRKRCDLNQSHTGVMIHSQVDTVGLVLVIGGLHITIIILAIPFTTRILIVRLPPKNQQMVIVRLPPVALKEMKRYR